MTDVQYKFRVAALWAALMGLLLVPLFGVLAWTMYFRESGVAVFGITAVASVALLLLAVVCAIFGRP